MALKHDQQYPLKYNDEQRARWQRKADESGMSLAAWIRRALDDGPVYVTKVVQK